MTPVPGPSVWTRQVVYVTYGVAPCSVGLSRTRLLPILGNRLPIKLVHTVPAMTKTPLAGTIPRNWLKARRKSEWFALKKLKNRPGNAPWSNG